MFRPALTTVLRGGRLVRPRLGPSAGQLRNIFIDTESTPNPQVMGKYGLAFSTYHSNLLLCGYLSL
jgi:hypothetical protein